MNNLKLAPIILFLYNRSEHSKKVLSSLKKNLLSRKSELIIFCDGAKDINDKKYVNKVHKILDNLEGFAKIQIFKRKKNHGLKKQILSGLSYISKKYEKFIVLEDDIIVNENFLYYMNKSLNYYQRDNFIWHINGWNYPSFKSSEHYDIFFDQVMNCWGWATWSKNWKKIILNQNTIDKKFNKNLIYKLNLDGTENFWHQFQENKNKNINTWAIFWFITIFLNNAKCIRPKLSMTENIGLDTSGTHCVKPLIRLFNYKISNFRPKLFRKFSNNVDDISVNNIKKYYRLNNFGLIRYTNAIYFKIKKMKLFNIFNKF